MQDHFIKNVNDLSLCMTLTGNRAGVNTKVCTLLGTAKQGPFSLMAIILIRCSCIYFNSLSPNMDSKGERPRH